MSALTMNSSDRSSRAYSKEERAILDAYKEEYLKTSTPKERGDIVRTRMFKALTTHWDKHGIKYDPEKARTDLLKWAQNLWRIPTVKGAASTSKVFTVRKFDVVARTMKDKVEAEIDKILGPENAQDSTKRFAVYTTAVSQIIKNLTPEASRKLDEEVSKISTQGYPEEIRRQLVEKYYEKRLKDSAEANWKELGLHAVTFVAFEDSTGRIVAEIHDDIAELLGTKDTLKMKSFEQTYPKQAREMQRLVIEYVRDCLDRSHGKETTSPQPNILGTSDEGFPMISASYNKDMLHKTEASKLYREYLSAHYKLATNNRTEQCPYDSLVKDTSKFIKPEYLPDGFIFRDPHNTQLESIKEFFDHIVERERSLPPSQVFRFHNVTTARINGRIVPSSYPDDTTVHTDEAPMLTKPKRQRKSKKKGQQTHLGGIEPTTENLPDSGLQVNSNASARLQIDGESQTRDSQDSYSQLNGESFSETPARLPDNGEASTRVTTEVLRPEFRLQVTGGSFNKTPARLPDNGEASTRVTTEVVRPESRLQVTGESSNETPARLPNNGEASTRVTTKVVCPDVQMQHNNGSHTKILTHLENNGKDTEVEQLDSRLQMNVEWPDEVDHRLPFNNSIRFQGNSNTAVDTHLNAEQNVNIELPAASSQSLVGFNSELNALSVDDGTMFQYLCDNGAFSFPDFNADIPTASGSRHHSDNPFPQVSFTQMLMDDQPFTNLAPIMFTPITNENAKGFAERQLEIPSMVTNDGSHMAITNSNPMNGNFNPNLNDANAETSMGGTQNRNGYFGSGAGAEQPLTWRPVTVAAPQPSRTQTNIAPHDSVKTSKVTVAPRDRVQAQKSDMTQSSPVHILNKVLNDIPMTPTKGASKSKETAALAKASQQFEETPQADSEQASKKVNERNLKRKNPKVTDKVQGSRPTKKHLTSDDLAAREANELKVHGKRVPKKKIMG